MPITKSTSAGEIIKDFQDSDDPKFAGKSKEERRRMALGAYYSKHPEKSNKTNEDVQSALEYFRNGDTEAGNAAIHDALMDKVAARLEDMKVDIARQHFNLSNESVELEEAVHMASTKLYGKTHIAHLHSADGAPSSITFGVGKHQTPQDVANRLASGWNTTVRHIEKFKK